MSPIERLDAIATGFISLIAGGAIFIFLMPSFLSATNEMQQQEKTIGTVIQQRTIKVKNPNPRFYIGKTATVTRYCPTIRFETEVGRVIEFEECFSRSFQVNERVSVIYNRQAPASASTSQGKDELFVWIPALFMGLPLFGGGLFITIGAYKLYAGMRGENEQ